jgi:hypothetical protein
MNDRSDIEFLNDLDRGNYDCQHGNEVSEGESDAYYIAFGARHVYEQMATHHSEEQIKLAEMENENE